MARGYGVLRGTPDRWVREDGQSTPHLQIRILDDTGQPWRIAVNVRSDTGSDVVYWLVDPLAGQPFQPGLSGLKSGFTSAPPEATTAVDYVKTPMFYWTDGVALPPSGSGAADDLQDLLTQHLQACHDDGGEVFAFGVKFSSNLHKPIDAAFGNTDGLHGIHDIHMNQGNKGSHAADNGAFHDGGLILRYGGRNVGLFLAFQTQYLPTDAAGDARAQSRPLAELIAGAAPAPAPQPQPQPPAPTPAPAPTPVEQDQVGPYLERALLNPAGDDAGGEAVVIGNLANTAVPLQDWTLVDKNHRITRLGSITLSPGGSVVVALDGAGVQLSNKGGSLVLVDPSGSTVDTVQFTAADATTQDRYVRFPH